MVSWLTLVVLVAAIAALGVSRLFASMLVVLGSAVVVGVLVARLVQIWGVGV